MAWQANMRLALAAQVELTGCQRLDMTRMLYRAARTSQKIGASKPLEFRTFLKAARLKTMRGDTKVLFNTTFTFTGPVQVLQLLQKAKQIQTVNRSWWKVQGQSRLSG